MLIKAPNDNFPFSVDWTAEIGADTISSSTWTLETGITNDGDSDDSAQTTTIDVSGGVAGKTYTLTNQIATAAGDVYEKDLHLKVQKQILA